MTTTTEAPGKATDAAPAGLLRRNGLLALITGGFVFAWWLVTTVFGGSSRLLHDFAPQRAIPAIASLAAQGVLLHDVLASLWRLAAGLLIAAVVGLPVGVVTGLSPTLRYATRPVFQLLRMISPLSWAPVAVALFGIGHRPVFFLVAAAAAWPILLNTAQGVRAVDPGHLLVARSLGATWIETLRTVILPSIRGSVLTGIRLALGIAWVVLVPGEMLGVDSGLGYEILNARDQLAYDKMMGLILVIGVLGSLLDAVASRTLTSTRRAVSPDQSARAAAADGTDPVRTGPRSQR
jgi:NitT/TauT family transport system permease protein